MTNKKEKPTTPKPTTPKPTKTQILKKQENYSVVKFDWGKEYIFPYEAGIALMELFKLAEQLKDHTIIPILYEQSPILSVMSQTEYLDKKMSHILGVEVKGTSIYDK